MRTTHLSFDLLIERVVRGSATKDDTFHWDVNAAVVHSWQGMKHSYAGAGIANSNHNTLCVCVCVCVCDCICLSAPPEAAHVLSVLLQDRREEECVHVQAILRCPPLLDH